MGKPRSSIQYTICIYQHSMKVSSKNPQERLSISEKRPTYGDTISIKGDISITNNITQSTDRLIANLEEILGFLWGMEIREIQKMINETRRFRIERQEWRNSNR